MSSPQRAPPSPLQDGEHMPYRRGQDISESELEDQNPNISLPVDFEHFLHVGAQNLGDVNVLCRDQQKAFEEVVARRTRRLPQPPQSPMIDDKRTNKPTPRMPATAPATPRAMSRQSSSSSQQSGRSAPRTPSSRLLRTILRSDTPSKRRGKEDTRQHVQEAIESIEQGRLQRLSELLESDSVDANACDADGHTLLDLAVMLNQIGCVKLLQLYGGVETEAYVDPKVRERRLEVLLRAKQIALGKILDDIKAGARNLYQEHEESRVICERSVSLYRKWHKVYRSAGKPAAPRNVRLSTSAPDAITVHISDVLDHGGAVVTRYKVLWSNSPSFEDAEHIFIPAVVSDFTLTQLPQGKPCFVRVASCNMTGVGPAVQSTPPFLVPSSWREVDNTPSRIEPLHRELASIEEQLAGEGLLLDTLPLPKKNQKFGHSLKLTKPTKRGLYFAACVFDRNDRNSVLAHGSTLPCVLVDEHIGTQDVAAIVQFLQMLSFSWRFSRFMSLLSGDVHSLHTRRRAAEAVAAIQHAVGAVNLGVVYFQPLVEECGATTIVACSGVARADVKTNLTWTSSSALKDNSNLLGALSSMVEYGRGCLDPLQPGLYLASVFPHSTVNGLRISTRKSSPNLPPCHRLRAHNHVSKDEWTFLRKAETNGTTTHDRSGTATHGSELAQRILETGPKLLQESRVDETSALKYRLYTPEVIELNASTSLLVVVPDEDYSLDTKAVAVAESRQHITLAAKSLELLMWQRFQPVLTQQYARLWLSASSQVIALQFALRKALGPQAKEIDGILSVAQRALERLDNAWHKARFFSDVVRWCKDSAKTQSFVTLGDLKKRVRVRPEAPERRPSTTEKKSKRNSSLRLATDTQGKGLLTVFAQSRDDETALVRHKVYVPHTTAASRVTKTLIEEMQLPADNSDAYALFLVSASGEKKRVPDGCRPLLMQSQWEDEDSKLVLITR
ncbi:hypothetical protein PTSG_02243 [Salpingoeca rosetta]|uniref:Fibronectin type-III domain-containing protein n=1 Tax=Salpingoeca rosetta (strain ATCC 50818 / BSB-021) TaxID=946362 RepID=F2U1M2_SALR5|nr:uncharacterized protein PTSG_02243 [Salpingoeca rosetta]EGD81524.1 hypothetical protein PTSG_02243 [Salpingoeca rosetta]|eukprot:XP_004996728.1 hypothetical protein PTSG_02243 [Salpingoeca rosetta]